MSIQYISIQFQVFFKFVKAYKIFTFIRSFCFKCNNRFYNVIGRFVCIGLIFFIYKLHVMRASNYVCKVLRVPAKWYYHLKVKKWGSTMHTFCIVLYSIVCEACFVLSKVKLKVLVISFLLIHALHLQPLQLHAGNALFEMLLSGNHLRDLQTEISRHKNN